MHHACVGTFPCTWAQCAVDVASTRALRASAFRTRPVAAQPKPLRRPRRARAQRHPCRGPRTPGRQARQPDTDRLRPGRRHGRRSGTSALCASSARASSSPPYAAQSACPITTTSSSAIRRPSRREVATTGSRRRWPPPPALRITCASPSAQAGGFARVEARVPVAVDGHAARPGCGSAAMGAGAGADAGAGEAGVSGALGPNGAQLKEGGSTRSGGGRQGGPRAAAPEARTPAGRSGGSGGRPSATTRVRPAAAHEIEHGAAVQPRDGLLRSSRTRRTSTRARP